MLFKFHFKFLFVGVFFYLQCSSVTRKNSEFEFTTLANFSVYHEQLLKKDVNFILRHDLSDILAPFYKKKGFFS